ncbi:MAG TPA: LptF/LptG family permease [Brumimicrobium sp.]|nr:LptF/LptG family permease [Brumimicrobium sp.]
MKKLSIFFIRSFVGPFLATFFISMFMLVMQFLWKYIDDLMGKGLEISIITELLFYVSASLLPLALPLAILLSSLIVMGNLGESNELTALKSSGLSIYRILRPLTAVVILIAVGTFYFSNYVIPIANYKWHSIIWDIQEKKMTSFLKPGSYTQEIDGFSIKIKDGKDNSFNEIIIHDRRVNNEIKTITAKSGEFYQSENGEFLFFKLFNGSVIEELSSSPDFQGNNDKGGRNNSIFPSRKSEFKSATYKMDMSGFKLQRSKDDLFKNDYEMLNVFQINETADSIKTLYQDLMESLSFNSKAKHAYFQVIHYITEQEIDSVQRKNIEKYIEINKTVRSLSPLAKHQNEAYDSILIPNKNGTNLANENVDSSLIITPVYAFENMSAEKQEYAINHMKSQLRSNINSLEGQMEIEKNRHRTMRRYEIEFHRKFALSFSIIILFFVGAPLGAIVKRGGFGAPVVIAALLFMVYFVLITIGDGMAESQILSPFFGMWGPNILLSPIAALLMISAAKDRSIVAIPKIFKKKKKSA